MEKKTAEDNREGKPDFDSFAADFLESYAFQVPYDGSNNFYNDKKLNDPHIQEALDVVYKKYVLPLQATVTQLNNALVGGVYSEQLKTISAAQSRISELEQGQRWIPVEERLPDNMKHVLAFYGPKHPVRAYRHDGRWILYYYSGASEASPEDVVTHWQPLPKSPLPSTEKY